MRVEFANGYELETMHHPDRKKPLLYLARNGSYKGHATFKDEESLREFNAFIVAMWGGWREDSLLEEVGK